MAASSRQSTTSSIANFFCRSTSDHFVPNPSSPDFEFDESDLYLNDPSPASPSSNKIRKASASSKPMRMKLGSADESRSVPVSIPAWSTRVVHAESEGSDEGDDDDEERVPPHEYLARKRGASLSVHEGVGRTLKGRDMRRVRNDVWKRIGFED